MSILFIYKTNEREIMSVFAKTLEIYSLFFSQLFHVVLYFPSELNQMSLKSTENLPLTLEVVHKVWVNVPCLFQLIALATAVHGTKKYNVQKTVFMAALESNVTCSKHFWQRNHVSLKQNQDCMPELE